MDALNPPPLITHPPAPSTNPQCYYPRGVYKWGVGFMSWRLGACQSVPVEQTAKLRGHKGSVHAKSDNNDT